MATYSLLDSGEFEKLERVGDVLMVRPSASSVWGKDQNIPEWKTFHVQFDRDRGGDGDWKKTRRDLPDHWDIEVADIRFRIRLTSFGHLGLFPEQAKNWRDLRELIMKRKTPGQEFRVLNLFAYTGGSSLACAQAGADVTHVDSSKTSVSWAKENLDLNQLKGDSIRWIIDDVNDFVSREVRRGNRYHGIILDPPSFGRGTKKQVWKIERDLMPLLVKLKSLLAEDAAFCLLSSHSPGYTALAHENQLRQMLNDENGNLKINSGEMILPGTAKLPVPSGAYSFAVLN